MRLLQHRNADRERSLFPPWLAAWVIPIIPVIPAPWGALPAALRDDN